MNGIRIAIRLDQFLVENLWAILDDKLEDVKSRLSKIQSLKKDSW